MTGDDRSNIIDKIQALLNKTVEQGASEHEATEAIKMVHKLLTKYHLNLAEVAVPDKVETSVVEEYEVVRVANGTVKRTAGWQGSLSAIIGRGFYVRIIQQGGRLSFIGRPTNVAIVRELYNWCVPQVTNLAQEETRAQGHDPKYDRKYVQSLRLGILTRLAERITAMKNEAAAQDVKVTALVVAFDNENQEFIQSKHGSLQTIAAPTVNSSAYDVGHRAGGRVSLNPASRQVEGGS